MSRMGRRRRARTCLYAFATTACVVGCNGDSALDESVVLEPVAPYLLHPQFFYVDREYGFLGALMAWDDPYAGNVFIRFPAPLPDLQGAEEVRVSVSDGSLFVELFAGEDLWGLYSSSWAREGAELACRVDERAELESGEGWARPATGSDWASIEADDSGVEIELRDLVFVRDGNGSTLRSDALNWFFSSPPAQDDSGYFVGSTCENG
jgi:hypothetical protein